MDGDGSTVDGGSPSFSFSEIDIGLEGDMWAVAEEIWVVAEEIIRDGRIKTRERVVGWVRFPMG